MYHIVDKHGCECVQVCVCVRVCCVHVPKLSVTYLSCLVGLFPQLGLRFERESNIKIKSKQRMVEEMNRFYIHYILLLFYYFKERDFPYLA